MVAHTFTCPTGLYFNTLTDGCDFKRNVDCGGRDDKEVPAKDKSTTTVSPLDEDDDDDSEEDPRSLKEILSAIKTAGKFVASFSRSVTKPVMKNSSIFMRQILIITNVFSRRFGSVRGQAERGGGPERGKACR